MDRDRFSQAQPVPDKAPWATPRLRRCDVREARLGAGSLSNDLESQAS